MYLIEKILENVKENPNMSALYDENMPKGLTYGEMDIQSSKVYGYLKGKGIGKEDFVLINLPRGMQPIVAMIGIWKAGAAFSIVEDNYAPERINYIREDCGCKIEINSQNWDEIMLTDPLEGFEKVDPHDAAYAIYTSGTTGNPKGVLHEFGNLEETIASINLGDEALIKPGDHGALLAPMNFVASIMVLIYVLYMGNMRLYVVSYTTLKNPMLLMKFFLEKRINITFLTPSYVRMLSGKTGPFLKRIIVGSEPANHLYIDGVKLYNMYAMSESGFVVSVFEIDKSYDTCPIGQPHFDLEYFILGEDGKEVGPGETGELCFRNKYVRGYINLEEETKEAFVDGIYHTGDLARADEKGDMVLLGRSNDMIKINGNRIEPAEIEAAVKNVLNLDWVAAKGFEEEGQAFLCAYYKEDVEIDLEKTREELLKRLPYYMLPAYFMKIDEIPLKPNGKLDRKALPKPDTSDFQSDYVEPSTETEKKICQAFAQVLKLGKVGINDDFYELGGDSLGAIQMIDVCDLPGLSASEIFRGRTPEKIAKLYERIHAEDDGISPDEKNDAAMETLHPLTFEQLYMVDYQLNKPMSTMYNLFSLMKIDKDQFDMKEMARALETAIKNHPALLTTYTYDEDWQIVQKYTPEVLHPINVEYLTEWEFKYNVKDYLVQPFKISDPKVANKLFRCRVFETEEAGYVFFDVHHSIFDGTSFKVFMGNVGKAYLGLELEKDYYYLMLKRREDAVLSDFYEESRKYYEEKYNNIKWSAFPKVDIEDKYVDKSNRELGEIISELGISRSELETIERINRISRNEFFITASLLSMYIFNKKEDIMVSWIYNGREDKELMTTVGLLFRELPVGVHINDDMNIRDLYSIVHEQVQKGIEHSCYPYIDKTTGSTEIESAYLLYQQDLRDADGMDAGMDMETIDIRQNQAATQTMLDIEILDGSDGLEVMLDYAKARYEDESMEKYKLLFMKTVKVMTTHNSQEDVTIKELKKEIKDSSALKAIGKIANVFRSKFF